MAEQVKKDIKEVKAFARGVHISPRKARLVAHLVKNMAVGEALTQLNVYTKKAAQPIRKLVDSAIANARHNFQIEEDKLFIKSLTVDGGQVFFRYTPRAQGRAFPVRKRTSHLNLVLGVMDFPKKGKKTKAQEKNVDKPPQAAPLPEVQETKEEKSRFAFWRRKNKAKSASQVPPKEDPKGKRYTGFDRRGNM